MSFALTHFKNMKWLMLACMLAFSGIEAKAQRAFLLVDSTSTQIIDQFNRRGAHGLVRAVELTPNTLEPGPLSVGQDTLYIWVQHYGPGATVFPEIMAADLTIMCYPEMLPAILRDKHVLPRSSGQIYIYRMESLIIVSDKALLGLDAVLTYIRMR